MNPPSSLQSLPTKTPQPIEIDVVFLSHAHTPALHQITVDALASLEASEDPTQIRFLSIVVESHRDSGDYPAATTIHPRGNFGYHRFMNIGVQAGGAPFVCMCNNDLVFHPGWATQILKAFACDPALMSASPRCGQFHARVLPPNHDDIITGYQNGVHVAGWCLFVRRALFQQIGGLDERFRFWYCDDDYRLTLQSRGLKHALITHSRVDHLGSYTLNTLTDSRNKARMTSRQALLFHYKWGHRSWVLYWLKRLKYSLLRH